MIIVDENLPEGDIPPPFASPRSVHLKEEEDVRDNYDLKTEIGRGRFGTVYLCTCKKSGQKFAAKFVNTKRTQDRTNVEREIEIMRVLNEDGPHQKLIQLYDAYDLGKEICLVLEVVQGGELFERVIDDDFELTERACAIFLRQICEGIEFIHSKNILHLDMKPENILCLTREGNRIKICDFGLARKYDPRKKLQVLFGTPEFVAPEVVNFEPIGFGTDMWSVGVICYVLLSGLSPFMGHNYVETMTNVTHNDYDFDDEAFDEVSDEVKDFIERLLLLDKSSRMTPQQCMHHPWLKEVVSEEDPTNLKGGKALDKENLKKFISRRRWHKMMNTFSALKRMGANFDCGNKIVMDLKSQAKSFASPEPGSLVKTSSSPNVNVDLGESSSKSTERESSPEIPRNFQRCLSATETSDALSHDILAKTLAISRSSTHLDSLQEEYEINKPQREKRLASISEGETPKQDEEEHTSPPASTGAIAKGKVSHTGKSDSKSKSKGTTKTAEAPATKPLVDQLLSQFHSEKKASEKTFAAQKKSPTGMKKDTKPFENLSNDGKRKSSGNVMGMASKFK